MQVAYPARYTKRDVDSGEGWLEIPSCQTPFPATTASGTAAGGCSRCSVPNICETAVGEF